MRAERISDPQRRDRLLLLNALAIVLLTLLGAAGESLGLARQSRKQQRSLQKPDACEQFLWRRTGSRRRPEETPVSSFTSLKAVGVAARPVPHRLWVDPSSMKRETGANAALFGGADAAAPERRRVCHSLEPSAVPKQRQKLREQKAHFFLPLSSNCAR